MGCIRGTNLRYALTQLLFDSGQQTVDELVQALAEQGLVLDGRPSKTISDALRWEVRRGRVYKLGRGRYGPGHMPRQTASRIRNRVDGLRCAAADSVTTRLQPSADSGTRGCGPE